MATCPGLRLILLIFNAVGVRAYECNFSSPDAKYMIEYLPNSFQYQTARIPIPGKSNTLHINLAITGLKLMRADSKAVPYVWNSTSYWIEESAKRIKKFSNGCVDEVNGNTVTCYYNGSTLLDADYQYLDETAMFFYADNIDSAPNPLCSLHIIKYEKAREKLFGTFKYDEDRSENEPTLYFRFIPAVDAFPQTIYVKPTLTCLGGAHTYNLTQISTEDNVFTMERSGFRSSIDCKIKINNEKDSKELNVVLPTIQQLTTLPPITTSKDQTPTVLGVSIAAGLLGSLAIVFLILFLKNSKSLFNFHLVKVSEDAGDMIQSVKPLSEPAPDISSETNPESPISVDALTPQSTGCSHTGNEDVSCNTGNHVYSDSEPGPLIGPTPGNHLQAV